MAGVLPPRLAFGLPPKPTTDSQQTRQNQTWRVLDDFGFFGVLDNPSFVLFNVTGGFIKTYRRINERIPLAYAAEY